MPEDTKAQVGSWAEGGGMDNICSLQGIQGSHRWCPRCGGGSLRVVDSLRSSSGVCTCVCPSM